MTFNLRLCITLLAVTPAFAGAQDPVPSPPKQEIVTIRSAGGTLELKALASAELFEFTQQCESRQGVSAATVSLTLPLEIEGGPNGSLEQVASMLREAVAKGFLVTVEAEPGSRPAKVMVVWGGGLPEFEGVLESLATKFTMFLTDGTPVRATATLRIKEANALSVKKGGNQEGDKSGTSKQTDCSPAKP